MLEHFPAGQTHPIQPKHIRKYRIRSAQPAQRRHCLVQRFFGGRQRIQHHIAQFPEISYKRRAVHRTGVFFYSFLNQPQGKITPLLRHSLRGSTVEDQDAASFRKLRRPHTLPAGASPPIENLGLADPHIMDQNLRLAGAVPDIHRQLPHQVQTRGCCQPFRRLAAIEADRLHAAGRRSRRRFLQRQLQVLPVLAHGPFASDTQLFEHKPR
ncbi:hypothetical protein D3C75_853540 [compost metagenome]